MESEATRTRNDAQMGSWHVQCEHLLSLGYCDRSKASFINRVSQFEKLEELLEV